MEDKNTEYGKLLRELLEQKQYTKLRQEVADMNVADVAAPAEPAAEPEDTLIEETIKGGQKRILKVVEKNRSRCQQLTT